MTNRWQKLLVENDYVGVKVYLKEGADIEERSESDESVLALAIKRKCDLDLLELLIENGADVLDFDEEGVSVLDYAITYNNLAILKRLVELNAPISQTNRKSGFTPLMGAVCYGRPEITTFLLEQGVDAEAKDSSGMTAMRFARKMRKKKIIVILTEHGIED